MILYIFQGVVLAFSAAIMPGPFQAFLLSKALQQGWKRTLPAAFAPLFTDGPIIALALVVLTQIPSRYINVLHIAGGLFILYIARGIFLTLNSDTIMPEFSTGAGRKSFFQAVVMNLLNPNPYIFWSVVGGPIVLAGWRESSGLGIGFLVGFFGTFVASLAALIVLFATAGKISPKFNKILRGFAGAALLVFGVYQIWIGTTSVIGPG